MKAGALTPATPGAFRRPGRYRRRSMKAGALTPATQVGDNLIELDGSTAQ